MSCPGTREEPVVYISARPFVLRDSVRPTQTFAISERAENIEAIEYRSVFEKDLAFLTALHAIFTAP